MDKPLVAASEPIAVDLGAGNDPACLTVIALYAAGPKMWRDAGWVVL